MNENVEERVFEQCWSCFLIHLLYVNFMAKWVLQEVQQPYQPAQKLLLHSHLNQAIVNIFRTKLWASGMIWSLHPSTKRKHKVSDTQNYGRCLVKPWQSQHLKEKPSQLTTVRFLQTILIFLRRRLMCPAFVLVHHEFVDLFFWLQLVKLGA